MGKSSPGERRVLQVRICVTLSRELAVDGPLIPRSTTPMNQKQWHTAGDSERTVSGVRERCVCLLVA